MSCYTRRCVLTAALKSAAVHVILFTLGGCALWSLHVMGSTTIPGAVNIPICLGVFTLTVLTVGLLFGVITCGFKAVGNLWDRWKEVVNE